MRRKAKRHQSGTQLRLTVLLALLIVTVVGGSLFSSFMHFSPHPVTVHQGPPNRAKLTGGQLLSKTSVQTFSLADIQKQDHYVNGSYYQAPKYRVEKSVVSYRSYDTDGTPLTIYARIYQPVGVNGAPILAMAPGTTGIGDECAASLEDPVKASWADYEAHMLTYASQGYASVITDYEGMRDGSRIHHYMVGPLEGRAVLDSIRALITYDKNSGRVNTQNIFMAGYSQGGHSVLWADQIASSYAPELHIRGVVGFGAVVNVDETLSDVTRGSDLDWFGPYVLTSYSDYYHEAYPLSSILLPKWIPNLKQDVIGHCINTDLSFWGTSAQAVYTPQFISAMQANAIGSVSQKLAERMSQNDVGPLTSITPILLNGGTKDNVVLPSQQTTALVSFCSNQIAPVHLHEYPGMTHYNTMAASLKDTLAWMNNLVSGKSAPSDCGTTS